MTRSKFRRIVLGIVCALTMAPLLATTASAATRPHHARPHHTRRVHHKRHGGIPQHNGGDRDSDNNGAPSDGDGNQ